MYSFIDVTQVSDGLTLPSEALKINNEYIENQIPGYRTLNVRGREALSPDVVSYTTGIRDGSRIQSKRYPERIITVSYQLIAATNEEFREAYNKLGAILNVQDAELIFNDEQDKYFIGTPCIIGDVSPGTNAVVGDFEILCADPFKYSIVEYEAEPGLDAGSVLIDYNGTYKSFPKLRAEFYNETDGNGETASALTGNGDCGYVAFFTEDEKIVQMGNPDEADGESSAAKSQTLVNSEFKTISAWGTSAISQWPVNSGVTSSSAVVQTGNVAMAVASYAATAKTTSGTLLTARSTASAPNVDYKVTAKTSGRTSNSVKVAIAITGSLGSDSSYFLSGYILNASIYIGGSWHNVTLKKSTDQWRGKTGHTVNLNVTVTGLSASTTSLTGIKFKVTRGDDYGTTGILAETNCKNLAISAYAENVPETYYLAPSNFGSGTDWHGPSITRTIPADASGVTGAANFTFSYAHKFCIGTGSNATNEVGAFQVLLSDVNGNVVCGMNVYKGSAGKKASLRFYVGGTVMETTSIDVSNGNKTFSAATTSTITKSGDSVTFNIGGVKKVYRDEDIAETAVRKVTITMTRHGTKTGLSYNGLFWAKFVKNNCSTWKDIPNKFSANDVVEADCKNGEIYLNGTQTPILGALGNDWEEFYLTPGLNQIGYSYSDWVQASYAPKIKVLYREVFL